MAVQRDLPYHLEKLLSKHPPFETWMGRDRLSGRLCILKIFDQADETTGKAAGKLLRTAVQLQKLVRCNCVVTANRVIEIDGAIITEYPYLDDSRWERVTPEKLLRHWKAILIELSLVVDYVHLRGLVHGDLKLENLLISFHEDRCILQLIDLDFLQCEATEMRDVVIGTPGHIAPEVITTHKALPQSDLYSMGTSLQLALEQQQFTPDQIEKHAIDQISLVAASLTKYDHLLRPRSFLAALRESGIVNDDSSSTLNKRLLGMLAANVLGFNARRALRESDCRNFLLASLHLVGVPNEVLIATIAATKLSLKQTFRAWREYIRYSSIERYAEFLCLLPRDEATVELLRQLDALIQSPAVKSEESLLDQDTIVRCKKLLLMERPIQALVLSRRLLNNQPSESLSLELHALAATCDLALNRQSEALMHLRHTIEMGKEDDRYPAMLEGIQSAMRAGDLDEAERLLQLARNEGQLNGQDALALRFGRFECWLLIARGKLDEARVKTADLERRSTIAGDPEVEQIAQYLKGILSWRMGEIEAASIALTGALTMADRHVLTAKSVPVLVSLASLNCERAQYLQAIVHAKKAIQLARVTKQPALLPPAYMAICYSCARIAKFAKGRFWLQQYLLDSQVLPSSHSLQGYYVLRAFLELQEGRFEDAERSLQWLLEVSKSAGTSPFLLKAYQNMVELAWWKGNKPLAEKCSGLALDLAEKIGDKVARDESVLAQELVLLVPKQSDLSAIYRICQVLACEHSNYRTALTVFFLHCNGYVPPEYMRSIVHRMVSVRGSGRVPLFAALSALGYQAPDQMEDSETCWKDAYQALLSGQQLFLATYAAMKVAECYLCSSKRRHALTYLTQARIHSRALCNESLTKILESKISQLQESELNNSSLVDLLSSVSTLMTDLHSYHRVLEKLLQFAVDYTGAERGLLLMVKPDRSTLQPVASYNCDEQSVRELTEFSSTIPMASIADSTPVFIDNACLDATTNCYRSVVAHNILSVACIPVVSGKEAVAVPYLDHHLIPALFGSEDRKLMGAIAGIMSVTIIAARELRSLASRTTLLRESLTSHGTGQSLITGDLRMLRMLEKLPQIAASSASVLLLGESGTGKEILCDMLHDHSFRCKEPLVKINCASFSVSMVEAELFGVARGAATGVKERAGRFEAANGGTLFLDEIADMPLDVQAKILRVIEYQQFERVGSVRSISIDVRFVFATHQNIEQLVRQGRFRDDLYHRISTVTIEIPPLRERRGDIHLLTEHFIQSFANKTNPPRFTKAVLDFFERNAWPGNVRQLRSVVEFCCLMYPGELVNLDHLPTKLTQSVESDPSGNHASEQERELIIRAMQATSGNQTKAAVLLGLNLSSLRRRLKKYCIK